MQEDEKSDVLDPLPDGSVPEGYLLGDDGKLYRQRIVAAGVSVIISGGMDEIGAAERAERVEKAMADAIKQAVADGISPDDPAIRERILAARDEALKQ